ncbi:MAG: hypothetical protein AAGB16_07575 [Pseudomonadota bacterium]
MNLVKTILIIVAILFVIGIALWHFFLREQVAFAQVATAYGAKQVCSCRFLAEREFESCLGDFTEDVSQIRFKVSSSRVAADGETETEDTVTASVLGGLIKNQARYEPGLGCTLVKP